jgi:DNA-binding NarL/FixJ family response regulator
MNAVLLALRDADQAAAWADELRADGHWQLLPAAHSLADLRQALTRQQPDVLVADLLFADGPLAELVRVLRNGGRHRNLPVLAVTHREQDPLLLNALQAGADSFFMPGAAWPGALVAQVADTLAGGADIAPWIARSLLDHFGLGLDTASSAKAQVEELVNPLALVATEHQLLRQLSAGLRLNDVAAVEGVRPRDLTARVRTIYRKMQWALRAGDLTLA